jgi:hypothetical protein
VPAKNELSITEGNIEVSVLTAMDFNGNEINSFLLSGTDQDFFIIENGNLKFKNPVDFETQSTYSVNIIALDDFGNSAIISLIITAEDGKKKNALFWLIYFVFNSYKTFENDGLQ